MKYWNSRVINACGVIRIRWFIGHIAAAILTNCPDSNFSPKFATHTSILLMMLLSILHTNILLCSFTYFKTIGVWTFGIKLSIDCFNVGATVASRHVRVVPNDGRINADGLTGSRTISGSGSSTISVGGFSGSGGFSFECFANSQPFIFKNSVKSTLFLLQHVQPLYASWKNGTPGWWRHASDRKLMWKKRI